MPNTPPETLTQAERETLAARLFLADPDRPGPGQSAQSASLSESYQRYVTMAWAATDFFAARAQLDHGLAARDASAPVVSRPEAAVKAEALREVRLAMRAARKSDPSTYNVWSRISGVLDRVEDSLATYPEGVDR